MTIARKRFRVSGFVQGVGFRPFVWRLANELGCSGIVCNDASGVSIEAQAPEACLEAFQIRLWSDAPPASRIKHVAVEQIANVPNENGFAIIESQHGANIAAWVAPDIAVCEACLSEMRDPSDRRYGYPFINCTACGPRFTIIESLPYDRSRTTMRDFELCRDCRREYESPADGRFHAEPNACSLCGPTIWFARTHDSEFEAQTNHRNHCDRTVASEHARTDQVLNEVRACVAAGEIVAIKGVGGFHLVCDATNVAAVQKLRERKQRPHKPFAVMVSDIDNCELLSKIGRQECEFLRSRERPIVLIEKNALVRTSANVDTWIEAVAPKNPCLGVMLAYSPLHHLLIPSGQIWLMTSGNLAEEPIAMDNAEAWSRLRAIADGFLFHDRPISVACDDSVLRVAGEELISIRRSRGYSPLPVPLASATKDLQSKVEAASTPTVLAVGGELKATLCLAKESQAIVSQHIGDMASEESQRMMERVATHLMQLYQANVDIVAADLHPAYLSSLWAERFAKESEIPIARVQHHHAHAASLMVEHELPAEERIIACVFDGTGFGTDGTIWGGEWLLASAREFSRFATLSPMDLPGGDACILRPGRTALAIMHRHKIDWDEDLLPVQTMTENERQRLRTQLGKRFNCVESTSMGRLFDAVAALIGVRQQIDYEGQAAIELESLSANAFENERTSASSIDMLYPIQWRRDEIWRLQLGDLLRGVIADTRQSLDKGRIGLKFHRTLAVATREICVHASRETGIETVGLTGGVFQNALLTQLVRTELTAHGFRVLTHQLMPPNDAGIALGQAAIARSLMLHMPS